MNSQRGLDYLRGTVTMLRAKGSHEEAGWLAEVVALVQQSDMTARSVEEVWQILATHGFLFKEGTKLTSAIIDVATKAGRNIERTKIDAHLEDIKLRFEALRSLLHAPPAEQIPEMTLSEAQNWSQAQGRIARLNIRIKELESQKKASDERGNLLWRETVDLRADAGATAVAAQAEITRLEQQCVTYRERLAEWPKQQNGSDASSLISQRTWDDAVKEIEVFQNRDKEITCTVRRLFEIVDTMSTTGERYAAEDKLRTLAGCPPRPY